MESKRLQLKNFNVRLSPDTLQKIAEIAKAQKRTIQSVIEIMVEETFNNLEK